MTEITHTAHAEHGEILTDAFTEYAHGPVGSGWPGRVGVADCGHVYTNLDDTGRPGISTGYATRPDGLTLCYLCADITARLDMAAEARKDHGTVHAYVSADGRHVTTWTGGPHGHLAEIISHGIGRSGWAGSEIHSWRAISADGRAWYGRNGGPGMAITLRTVKRDPEAERSHRRRAAARHAALVADMAAL
ncbi:hypothetical protein Mbo2_099 [Rhodococcus phage Mbo2]|uniref:Uncharacterized protein n=1 Tax=Rhodococcus phage Mbo2 TaxID=2936911 RepID=A0A9E7LH66_9CAUD|nr:hypothetical protein Mbo2_099 [Rhodococcus phage Mbo2]